MRVLNSIVSGNTDTDVDFYPDYAFESSGYNVIGDGNATTVFNRSGDQTGVADPKLSNLADNGGPTETHAVQAGSPAIDKGNLCLSRDQRSVTRPQDGDRNGTAQCDIGAFELERPLLPPIIDIPFCTIWDCVRPTITSLRPAAGSVIRDRTPTIRATVRDDRANLAKRDIKLYMDGQRKTTFSYNRATDRLAYTSGKLTYGRHTVRILATDGRNEMTRSWVFRVVR